MIRDKLQCFEITLQDVTTEFLVVRYSSFYCLLALLTREQIPKKSCLEKKLDFRFIL